MRVLRILALTTALAAPLGACGFQPLYAPAEVGGSLSRIAVGEIEGKTGHSLKAQLERITSAGRDRNAAAEYTLSVKLEERLESLGLRIDSSATRTDLILIATYVLTDANGAEALKGSLQTSVGYDVPISAYGEFAAQNDARERAGEIMAELLRADLASRLAPRGGASPVR